MSAEPAPTRFQITQADDGQAARLRPISSASGLDPTQLKHAVAQLIAGGLDRVAFDLSEMTEIDQDTLAVLRAIEHLVRDSGTRLTIVFDGASAHFEPNGRDTFRELQQLWLERSIEGLIAAGVIDLDTLERRVAAITERWVHRRKAEPASDGDARSRAIGAHRRRILAEAMHDRADVQARRIAWWQAAKTDGRATDEELGVVCDALAEVIALSRIEDVL